ncbi:putative transposase [Deinococcus humi]|uniref:Putative transposase n=1 Tax=Deinococcus humi TaxID=662880 RepID=A0A7W8NJU7_9DEIO|nr:putative transposase [Deinococcus humi]GGI66840.1 hypothetical protein GCM10008949_53750 [Deinococcus humi]
MSIIGYAIWLYHRFTLSYRDVQELLLERGIQVSHETLREWCIKFAPLLAEALRHREGPPGFPVVAGRSLREGGWGGPLALESR